MVSDKAATDRVLVVTARDYEANAVLEFATGRTRSEVEGQMIETGEFANTPVSTVVADVGPVASGLMTAKVLRTDQDFAAVISAGIAGAFPWSGLAIGDVVVATHLHHGDFGADTESGFVPGEALDWPHASMVCNQELVDRVTDCVDCRSGPVLTVTRQSASQERVRKIREAWPDVLAEAMEGIGVAAAAAEAGLPFIEIRAISNMVGPRESNPWNKPAALDALAHGFRAFQSIHSN